ncbi:MAG: arginine--tRNA ligase [Flavobacteriaceae bacterium]|nr:arginine--tRNA ligase [Flavobacteriaceae bacterium]
MKALSDHLSPVLSNYLATNHKVEIEQFEFQHTRKEFEGDITLVVFSLLRHIKANPVALGEAIGAYLVETVDYVIAFNVVKGFLNLSIQDSFYISQLKEIKETAQFGHVSIQEDKGVALVEYSSPNTNKPLHLGHIRNNLLGYAVAQILEASGQRVVKTQIINDRGIHICKSMVAWQKYGEGATPVSTGLKGDKLVGNYYVRFDQEYKKEMATLVAKGKSEDEAKVEAPLFVAAQKMLRDWEKGKPEVVDLWKTMNGWVYEGFDVTYKNLGVSFDSLYYESDTYLLGKTLIEEGLAKNILFKKEDSSVWIDLTEDGLDEKLLLRSDGTAVYMTQDLGTALQRFKDNPTMSGMVYTVGNEQDYHFKVLFLILQKLGFSWADSLYHLSYGMVDLPHGKMKSREGTVVDADDLMREMSGTAAKISEELGKLEGMSQEDKDELYHTIGLGALKYFILKVDPKKRILFDPESSVDFAGNTGPFIQYTYARIQSILRKAPEASPQAAVANIDEREKEIIKHLLDYPAVVQQAASQYSPALIANYSYDLVKLFNSFYQNISILGEEDVAQRDLRITLSKEVSLILQQSMSLLGIELPSRM